MLTSRILVPCLVLGLAAGSAEAQILSDGHLAGVQVGNSGYVGGELSLDGVDIGFHYESPSGTCSGFQNGSAVTVSGTTASYTADCGVFDVDVTVRLLSPVPSLPSASAGYEIEYVYTNTTGAVASLAMAQIMDPDLEEGGVTPDDIASRDPLTGAIIDYDSGADPDWFLASIMASDDEATTASWELGPANSISLPLASNAGPFGPADVGMAHGYEVDVAAGASVTVRFRTLVARGISSVPADFDMSSCYTQPVSCRIAAKGQLALKDSADDTKDQLKWKFQNGEATTQGDFGNPTTTSDASLCIYEATGDQIVGLHVPASPSNWVAVGDKGYKLKDDTGANAGITKGQLQGGVLGKSKLGLAGKGANLPDPMLGGIGLPVTVQFHSGGQPGNCWESTLATQLKNDATQLKLKAP